MAISPRSGASTLPAETLSHILEFSYDYGNVGRTRSVSSTAASRQRQRLTFGRVCRSWFFATSASTFFYIGSSKQAKAFLAKLARERKAVAQEARKGPSGRITRATLAGLGRPSNIQTMYINLESKGDGADLAALIVAAPHLRSLDLRVHPTRLLAPKTRSALDSAFRSMIELQELKVDLRGMLHPDWILSCVSP